MKRLFIISVFLIGIIHGTDRSNYQNFDSEKVFKEDIWASDEKWKECIDDPYFDVNVQNIHGYTPLTLAIICGLDYRISYLLQTNKCNPNIQDRFGETCLHTLCYHKNPTTLFKELLKYKEVDITVKNYAGNTFLYLLSNNALEEIAPLCASIINFTNKKGETVLSHRLKYLHPSDPLSYCFIASLIDDAGASYTKDDATYALVKMYHVNKLLKHVRAKPEQDTYLIEQLEILKP